MSQSSSGPVFSFQKLETAQYYGTANFYYLVSIKIKGSKHKFLRLGLLVLLRFFEYFWSSLDFMLKALTATGRGNECRRNFSPFSIIGGPWSCKTQKIGPNRVAIILSSILSSWKKYQPSSIKLRSVTGMSNFSIYFTFSLFQDEDFCSVYVLSLFRPFDGCSKKIKRPPLSLLESSRSSHIRPSSLASPCFLAWWPII